MSEPVKVEGLSTLQATLSQAAREMDDFSGPAGKTSALLGARGRVDAPRLTGRLAASVRGKAERSDAVVESGLAYARFVHWGTSRQRAQPWLVEGRDDTQETWLRFYGDQIDDVLGSVKGA